MTWLISARDFSNLKNSQKKGMCIDMSQYDTSIDSVGITMQCIPRSPPAAVHDGRSRIVMYHCFALHFPKHRETTSHVFFFETNSLFFLSYGCAEMGGLHIQRMFDEQMEKRNFAHTEITKNKKEAIWVSGSGSTQHIFFFFEFYK